MIAKTFLCMIRLRGTQHGNENADSSVNAVLDHNVDDEKHFNWCPKRTCAMWTDQEDGSS